MNITATIGALLLGLAFAAQAHADTSPTATLDAFYAASAGSNQSAFIAQLTEDAVLLGVDGGERLQGEALRDYVSKSFGSESATATNGKGSSSPACSAGIRATPSANRMGVCWDWRGASRNSDP